MTEAGVVWITGAGKGIGRAVALRLAAEGRMVAASARTPADLESLAAEAHAAPGRIAAFPLDVTDEAATVETVARIEAALGPIAVAILNAGTHQPVKAKTFDVSAVRRLVETNLMGAVYGLGALMPRLIQRGGGRIVVVGSVAGYAGLPTAAGYAASKAGVIALCEALKPDLERYGVALQLVSPGFVDTPLTRKNEFPMPFLITSDEAAEAIVAGLRSSRFEIVFPWRMKAAMKALRLLPYPLFFAITRRMVGRKD